MKKTIALRQLLNSEQLEFILEAHNGLGAKIVEESGFKGIWASGLSLSAQFGLRDNNEASWTQVLEEIEFMSDAATIPILLDGDTGYGNFNNMRRLVRKLEQRDIAGVCIEDKLFPKTNSFIKGEAQPLADIHEFCGKIKAGKDAQSDDDFVIVARVEAFIAGWGLDEALRRAEAYRQAGADAILIHSALYVPDEVLRFKEEWGNRCPVVIVPTKYYSTPTSVFRDHQFSLVIWANHLLRSSITAMQHTAKEIMKEQNLLSVEDKVAPVSEIFRLQGAEELQEAEKLYLPKQQDHNRAIILAASRGSELGELTEDKPKAMVDIGGVPLLKHIVKTYRTAGIKDLTVVRGYKKESISLTNIKYVDNDEFNTSGEVVSLKKALDVIPQDGKDLIISYGDVIFNKYILEILCEKEDAYVITVDTNWWDSRNKDRSADYVHTTEPYSRRSFFNKVYVKRISNDLKDDERQGEWMGFLKVANQSAVSFKSIVDEMLEAQANKNIKLPDIINELVRRGEKVRVLYTSGHWLDVDSLEDVLLAGSF